ADLDAAPIDAYDAYLRLHLLSHRAVKPHGLNMDGIFGHLANVVWTNYGPCAVADFQMVRSRLASRGPVTVYSVDKFPRMVRSEEHTSELQSRFDLVCRLLLEKKKNITHGV